jgi:hypothetical protein
MTRTDGSDLAVGGGGALLLGVPLRVGKLEQGVLELKRRG